MSWATSVGRVAATPKTDAPRNVPVRLQRRARLGEERDDRPLGRPLQAGEHHRRERPVGPADVVVEDVVDAGLRRGDGDVDLVPADDRVGEVREAAVAAVGAAVRASGSPRCACRPSTPTRRRIGSLKQTRRPITRTPLPCSVLDRVGEVVSVAWTAPILCASGTGAFQPTIPPSSFRSSSTALIRPWAIRSSTPLRSRRSAHASEVTWTARTGCGGCAAASRSRCAGRRVPQRVGGDEGDSALRPRRPRDREAAVLDEHRAAVRDQRRARLERARERAAARRTGSARPAGRPRSSGPWCRP